MDVVMIKDGKLPVAITPDRFEEIVSREYLNKFEAGRLLFKYGILNMNCGITFLVFDESWRVNDIYVAERVDVYKNFGLVDWR
jgi:hypothetical protein